MKPSSRKDYLRKIHSRYGETPRGERRQILDEFCAHCGYHRKYAIRLLPGPPPGPGPLRTRRPRAVSYPPRWISIRKAVWEAADYPGSVRLKALLPEWMPWIRRPFRLTPDREGPLFRMSPRSIDYRLPAPQRAQRRHLSGRTQPGSNSTSR